MTSSPLGNKIFNAETQRCREPNPFNALFPRSLCAPQLSLTAVFTLTAVLLLLTACGTDPTPVAELVAPLPTTTTRTAVSPYPVPTTAVSPTAESSSPTAYPLPQPSATFAPATATPAAATPESSDSTLFIPLVVEEQPPTETAVPPTPTAQPTPTPWPTVDFAAAQAELQAQGQAISFVKIGFHIGIGGNVTGLDEWMQRLDEAGVPFFLKSADNAGPVFAAQELMRESGVPHVLVFRTARGRLDGFDFPIYELPPQEAAEIHWQKHLEVFPPELDPSLVWLETINEVDKNRSEWLAEFALHTAQLALRDGYKWAAFGWSSGEPEPEHWQSPAMLDYLRLVAEHPDQLAIALHEYSYVESDIGDGYPYKIGRFHDLFRIADANGIPRPTVLITEWGWTYQHVPEPEEALVDIEWASKLYAPHPQIKGAAIWYLGGSFADIHNEAQQLIEPLMNYALRTYFPAPAPEQNALLAPELFPPPD